LTTTLTREALAKTAERRYRLYTCKNGLVARIQSITEEEKSAYEAIAYDNEGKFQTARMRLRRRKLLQLCLVDDNGKQLFTPQDVPGMKMDGGIASELFDVCVEHCGLGEASSIAEKKTGSAATGDLDLSSDSASSSESTTLSTGSTTSTPK
jgi:hypothetical protein